MTHNAALPFRLEIQWIKKTNRFEVHDRIHSVGGTTPDGIEWHLSQQQVADAIEKRTHSFYIIHGGANLEVITVRSRFGFRYIKTTADEYQPDNLLELASQL